MNGNEARVAGTMTLLWDCKAINDRMSQFVKISGESHDLMWNSPSLLHSSPYEIHYRIKEDFYVRRNISKNGETKNMITQVNS